jgi:hypothetical protein
MSEISRGILPLKLPWGYGSNNLKRHATAHAACNLKAPLLGEALSMTQTHRRALPLSGSNSALSRGRRGDAQVVSPAGCYSRVGRGESRRGGGAIMVRQLIMTREPEGASLARKLQWQPGAVRRDAAAWGSLPPRGPCAAKLPPLSTSRGASTCSPHETSAEPSAPPPQGTRRHGQPGVACQAAEPHRCPERATTQAAEARPLASRHVRMQTEPSAASSEQPPLAPGRRDPGRAAAFKFASHWHCG